MKKIALTTIMAILFMVTLAQAGMWIEGTVTNRLTGEPIENSNLEWRFLDGTRYVSTGPDGYYGFLYNRNWCDHKTVIISADGYITGTASVGDGSCCDCFSPCVPPKTPENTCTHYKVANFRLFPFGLDSDDDGIANFQDNCPTVPNGPDQGTCTSGNKGAILCQIHRDCGGCLAYCSLNQEDRDGDGLGDVCDGSPLVAAKSLDVPSFYLACITNDELSERFPYLCNPELGENATEADLTQDKVLANFGTRQNSELALLIVALFPEFYCAAQGGCNYACLGEAIEDFLNGRDAWFWPIYPDGKQELYYQCPDRLRFDEWINLSLQGIFENLFGDNFPEGELPWE